MNSTTAGDSGEAERLFRMDAERHSGINPEHHRSVATLAPRLCGKVFGFVKENLSGAQRRKDTARGEGGRGYRGKGRPLSPPQHTATPERDQRSGISAMLVAGIRHWA